LIADRYKLFSKEDTFLFGLGTMELLIILALAFFILGGKKIPELSKGLGRAVRNFKKGLHEPDAIDITPEKEKKPGEEEKKQPEPPRT
jgi:sec-independent protein translocase protein TatA